MAEFGGEDAARTAGWGSGFPAFRAAEPSEVRRALERFVVGASAEQVRAWDDTIPRLQREVSEVLAARPSASAYSAILEYGLVLDSRRADAVFLVAGPVLVIELKGKTEPSQADLDQVAAYARDLVAYHRECQDRPVHAVLVPTASVAGPTERHGVWITGPRSLHGLVTRLAAPESAPTASLDRFLDVGAYQPLPTLVQAARELLARRDVRPVWRARAATDPAVDCIARTAEEAARTRTRHLVLVAGVPGSGKTLVGLRSVHSSALDRLAVPREVRRPTVPALFLSGNRPLVTVLQYALRGAGGGGRTFVRHVKDYLDAYVPRPGKIPPEHVIVFDEAQRAFTADKVAELHGRWPAGMARSEPQHFVDLAERVPEWSVVVGLIGAGQEIHVGEEGGLRQWREAIERSHDPRVWTVHAPADLESEFAGGPFSTVWDPGLNLDTALRFHLASDLHRFVSRLLDPREAPGGAGEVAEHLWRPRGRESEGLRLWATRDLGRAKSYLRERYDGQPDARYGLLASSRDRVLALHGVDNTYQASRMLRLGAWFAEGDASPHSCRHLATCATEFDAQGLELDMALLAWGTDFRRQGGAWTDADARGYRRGGVRPVDPRRLRTNAYRVLLTRGRDGTVVFVPPERDLDETWQHLTAAGFLELPG